MTSLVLENLSLEGPFPTFLDGLGSLTGLTVSGNAFTGTISDGICSMPSIHIVGDEANCPNAIGTVGCCATVVGSSP